MRKPDLVLEQLFLDEKKNDDRDGTDLSLKAIRRSNEEILRSYPASQMKAAVMAKMAGRDATKPLPFTLPKISNLPFTLSAFAAAVCCLFAISMVTLRTVKYDRTPSDGAEVAGSERIKGSIPRLLVYKKALDKPVLLEPGTLLAANDVIQLSYISGGDAFGAIISVDGNGVVTQHYPDSGDTTALLSPKGEVSLDFSYKLDSAPKFERFIFISGSEKTSIAAYKKAVSLAASADKEGKFDITAALPPKTRAVGIILRK
jgi:hypothetical protein